MSCCSCANKLPAGSRFCNKCGTAVAPESPSQSRFAFPESYTPKHLAEKILTSKAALEGERKQVTVLFADLKGSMELLADRDPEEARKLLDPVIEYMMEAVHRYEGTVNQVMGDGIMALFGAPLALEDHAVRACYAVLRMQQAVIAEAAGQPYDVTLACDASGGPLLARGSLGDAIPFLERGVETCRAWNVRLHLPGSLTTLGSAYILAGRLSEALPLLEEGASQAGAGV
jgi:hypothetical protein